MGPHKIDYANFDWDEVDQNPFFCADPEAAQEWEDYLDGIRKDGNSVGAVIEVVAEGVPPGWGAPIYGKLSADLASAMMSINAVKGVEIGAGFEAATPDRRRERRRDAGRQRRARISTPTRPAASSAAFPTAIRSSCASPSSRPRRS